VQQPRNPVTLDDVAREAGVSRATVSRTLNGKASMVSEATKARVRAVAEELGYTTNLAAQAVAVGRSTSVGFVVDTIPDDYQSPLAASVFRMASRHQQIVLMAENDRGDLAKARRLVNRLRGYRPQMIFVAGSCSIDEPGMDGLLTELRSYEADGGRVVFIGQSGTPFDTVVVDDHRVGRDMARALHEVGYREFSVFSSGTDRSIGPTRMRGFVAGLLELGINLPPDRILYNDFSHRGGYRSAGELLGRRTATEAVFCVSDSVAIGAVARLREAGVRVGPDLAIAGCDDLPALRDIDPPLTTMRLPWQEVAEKAFDLANTADRNDARTVTLRGHPVMRASTPGLPRQAPDETEAGHADRSGHHRPRHNTASRLLVEQCGFLEVREQWDDEDGLDLIYEVSPTLR